MKKPGICERVETRSFSNFANNSVTKQNKRKSQTLVRRHR